MLVREISIPSERSRRAKRKFIPISLLNSRDLNLPNFQVQAQFDNVVSIIGAGLGLFPVETETWLTTSPIVAGAAFSPSPLAGVVQAVSPTLLAGITLANFPLETEVWPVAVTAVAGVSIDTNSLLNVVQLLSTTTVIGAALAVKAIGVEANLVTITSVLGVELSLNRLPVTVQEVASLEIAGCNLASFPLETETWLTYMIVGSQISLLINPLQTQIPLVSPTTIAGGIGNLGFMQSNVAIVSSGFLYGATLPVNSLPQISELDRLSPLAGAVLSAAAQFIQVQQLALVFTFGAQPFPLICYELTCGPEFDLELSINPEVGYSLEIEQC